jgi:hypothetical protein
MLPPDALRFFPLPQTITTYSRPPSLQTEGIALPAAGKSVSQSNLPVSSSKARNPLSKLVAP